MRPKSLGGCSTTLPEPSGCKEEAPGIFTAQLYSARECAATIRQAIRTKSWLAARVSVEDGDARGLVRPEVRSALILDNEEGNPLYLEFEGKVRTVVVPLIRKLWGASLYGCDGTQLIRYKSGGQYAPHKDSSEDPSEVTFASRYFTVLCYLNNNFEGGRTSFPGLDFVATPESGKALVFPSHYLHSAVPVSAGEKFVLLTWLCGPIPVRWI